MKEGLEDLKTKIFDICRKEMSEKGQEIYERIDKF